MEESYIEGLASLGFFGAGRSLSTVFDPYWTLIGHRRPAEETTRVSQRVRGGGCRRVRGVGHVVEFKVPARSLRSGQALKGAAKKTARNRVFSSL